MRIYSMTATFGKLSHQTLTLQPGMNIIEAPNEWGKSTWCAFLIAMLYGINTREHSKTGSLADKEHYMPWSGEPMSGSMELNWNGRDITIQRCNKGRGFFNDFKAFETHTGIALEELTAANCGQQLLGVEQSVFTRAGFLRHTDLPVTADEKLRSRLNALVTTGDESGESEELAQKLKEIKNRCRFNRTGLLPQAEAQRAQLERKLQELEMLEKRSEAIMQHQQELKKQRQALKNHETALRYEENRQYLQKMEEARQSLLQAQLRREALEKNGAGSVDMAKTQAALQDLRTLRDTRDDLHRQARLLQTPPQMPQGAEPFRGMDPRLAVEQAKVSARVYAEDSAKRYFGGIWLPVILVAAGAALLVVNHLAARIVGIVLLLTAVLWIGAVRADKKRRARTMHDLRRSYGTIPPEQWTAAAQQYADSQHAYEQALEAYRRKTAALEQRLQQVNEQIAQITADCPVSEFEAALLHHREQHSALAEARRAEQQAQELVRTLEARLQDVAKPTLPDLLDDSMEQTQRRLRDILVQQEQLVAQLGQCQGRLAALGRRTELETQLQQLSDRIDRLEQIYQAAVYGLQVQEKATQELQRRFAPRIAKRAQELMGRLTGGRYERLVLDQDLQLSSGAQGENTLRSSLWRSDGTADQLYLALRLAVAEALTPDAPLVLDDALVRFDEKRMAAALNILQELAAQKQVILFTCQERERKMQKKQEETR